MNIISLIKRAPKRTLAIMSMVAAAVIVPTTLLAWGPDRPTYTIEAPADHVTFNSITNNPNYGDERNFVTIKDAANQNAGGWTDDITVQNDKEYYVRMYVHNNGADETIVAKNVTANFNVPSYEDKRIQIDGYLSSTNAQPTKIWDQAVFHAGDNLNFSIAYVPGSASYTTNVFPEGNIVNDSVVSSGVKLGYDKYTNGSFDGNIPGCFQYSGILIFKVKAKTSDFIIEKTVRISDSTDRIFKESVNAKPGDKVDYQIYFQNTGGTQLKGVVIKDTLPAGMTYVKGSSKLFNSDGLKDIADGITAGGAIIGGYMPTGDAYLMFSAQVTSNDSLDTCGVNTLVNTAKATTNKGSKEDTANVIVDKICTPDVPPVVTPITPPVTPVTPPVVKPVVALPVTGAGDNIAAFLGLGSMVTSLGYYLKSRRGSLVR